MPTVPIRRKIRVIVSTSYLVMVTGCVYKSLDPPPIRFLLGPWFLNHGGQAGATGCLR